MKGNVIQTYNNEQLVLNFSGTFWLNKEGKMPSGLLSKVISTTAS